MTSSVRTRPITAREAEAYTPPLLQFGGQYKLKAKLEGWLSRPVEHDGNLLIEGDPGTGKTSILIVYLREQFRNPAFYLEEFDHDRAGKKARGERVPSVEETREWQQGTTEMIFFKQINGATDSEALLRKKIEELLYCIQAGHRVALIDELGELFFRGLDEMVRPILTEPGITVYATAQNFHSKRKTDSFKEENQRLTALLRRFSHRETTERPTESDHLKFLVFLIREWGLKVDHPDTLRLLVDRSNGTVGLSKRVLIKAIDEPDRRLTRELVLDADVDPVTE